MAGLGELGGGAAGRASSPSPPAPPPKTDRLAGKESDVLSLLSDPLLEWCPSLHSIQTLCLMPVSALPEQDESYRTSRLERAILRAASNGDIEILSWICYTRSRRNSIERCREAEALKSIDWRQVRDEEGSGPMNLAAQSGHADVVQLLVQHGAEVDERDGLGWTPLIWATNCSNLPLVSFLLSHGADVEAVSNKGASCEDFILSSAPEVGKDRFTNDPWAGPSRLPNSASARDPHDTDRQLIADIVFEHQQALAAERARRAHQADQQRRHHLRSISSTSSQDSADPTQMFASASSSSAGGGSGGGGGGTTMKSQQSSSSHSLRSKRSTMTLRKLIGRSERTKLAEAELRARELAEGRRRALLDVAVMMQVDYSDLIGEAPPPSTTDGMEDGRAQRKRERRRGRDKPIHSGLASGCGAIEVGCEPLSVEFDFDSVRPDQMLVVGEHEVKSLLHWLIIGAKPVRAPWIARSKPANVLYMCMRYACSLPDEGLLEEIVFGAVDRIEGNLYAHPTKMTHLAFWMHNCMLLLHYIQRDSTLRQLDSMREYHSLIAELIHEIYVFIIRDMERRIDKVMDAAMLEHNPMPEMEDVRFEGEWSFMKTLTGSMKRAHTQSISSPKRPLSQLFSSSDLGVSSSPPSTPSSTRQNGVKPSILAGQSMPPPLPPPPPFLSPFAPPPKTQPDIREAGSGLSASDLLAKPLPRTITLLLTSTLHILQLYEINPCIIVQALSQVFYWVGCELFNRILSQKKFLCKSKAMHIRLNISTLEDWVKTNALPMSIVTRHLSKLNQLISWLLCQSSLTEFDGLIATMQGLRDLSPNQMKQAVKEYRYEVGETRINPECIEYLDQLQADLDRRVDEEERMPSVGHGRFGTATQSDPEGRLTDGEGSDDELRANDDEDDDSSEEQHIFQAAAAAAEGRPQLDRDDTMVSIKTQTAASVEQQTRELSARRKQKAAARKARAMQKAIDRLFETGQSMINYMPPEAAEVDHGGGDERRARGHSAVLLNSRQMLPFALPSQTHALIVSPGDAFGFGRGHFMGTGTPSLKSMRNESLLEGEDAPGVSSRSGSSQDSRMRSIYSLSTNQPSQSSVPSSSPRIGSMEVSSVLQDVAASSTSSSSISAFALPISRPASRMSEQHSSSSNRSHSHHPSEGEGGSTMSSSGTGGGSASSRQTLQLYPQGKGLSAGSYWQPVPILPDDTLDVMQGLMIKVEMMKRHQKAEQEQQQRQRRRRQQQRRRRPSGEGDEEEEEEEEGDEEEEEKESEYRNDGLPEQQRPSLTSRLQQAAMTSKQSPAASTASQFSPSFSSPASPPL